MSIMCHKMGERYYDKNDYYANPKAIKQLYNHKSHFQKYRISEVLKIYTPGIEEKILDFGCGWGTFEKILSLHVKEIIGVDFSLKSIKDNPANNVKFINADVCVTGLEAGKYDAILCADIVEHSYPDDFERMISECVRILKKYYAPSHIQIIRV